MKKFKVVVADDEKISLAGLMDVLHKDGRLEVAAACNNGAEALKSILAVRPEIVILDINMPGLDGIALGRTLAEMRSTPYLIYVTAYQEHAVEALNLGARGYVLKPFRAQDVENAIQKAVAALTDQTSAAPQKDYRIAASEGENVLFFNQSDIAMVMAQNRKVYLLAHGKQHLCKLSLAELEHRLNEQTFFRTHRNYIVNLNKVSGMTPWFNNTYMISVISGGEKFEAPLSRDNIKAFKAKMNL